MKPKKVLLLGSGALKIGQAGEFDYSGSQAVKALKEEGIEVVVINPNIASVQTSEGFAYRTYFLPITPFFVEKVIEKERPDGVLLGFGGQTALNCGLALDESGVFAKYGVRVLGTGTDAIRKTEDRDLFKRELLSISVKTPKSRPVSTTKDAMEAAERIGYPVMIRAGFALGGEGSGVCKTKRELESRAKAALDKSDKILVEEYLGGWKEIEYEVVRDAEDNCITVCNMENFDPLGIHTGESIVVAPSQTLSNSEYHMLRELSIKVIRHFGIVGECNIQFALDPKGEDYRVIEVNARLSRSSALASKATGYPLAFVAAKIAIGKALIEIENSITKTTKACFEPALDYVVVKVPRWDFNKFPKVSRRLGTEMKSVGEVMAIGGTFEEALQKAVRMLDIGAQGIIHNIDLDIEKELKSPTDRRLFAISLAVSRGFSTRRISNATGIDPWFIDRMRNIVEFSGKIRANRESLLQAKRLGFSDSQIAFFAGKKEGSIRKLREKFGIFPVVRRIDTLAAEFPASTNYLYATYHGKESDVAFNGRGKVVVLGSGTYKIGSSVEFDWCAVEAANELRNLGKKTIMINCNPETVSTDYDVCDSLYFEELTLERVLDIYGMENPDGIVVSVGGQIPNELSSSLSKNGAKLLGTSAESVDCCEDRNKFSKLCDSLGISQPRWSSLSSRKEALDFASNAGYPVIARPSYVLSGEAMRVIYDATELSEYLRENTKPSDERRVVISKFIENAREVEFDGVSGKGNVWKHVMTEHIENAGVHSGDATMVTPPQRLPKSVRDDILGKSKRLSKALNISGPFNIQFIVKGNDVSVIECNLRASRSMPFVSKVIGSNLVSLSVRSMLGMGNGISREKRIVVGVKAPQFSFSRLKGADPMLGVEMSSTGEVGCIGNDFNDALLKAMISSGIPVPRKGVLLSISGDERREEFLESARRLSGLGVDIFATEKTRAFLGRNGISAKEVSAELPASLDLAICIPKSSRKEELMRKYGIRRALADRNIPIITNLELAEALTESLSKIREKDAEIRPIEEY